MCTYEVNYSTYFYSRPTGAHVTENHGLLRVATGWPMPTLTRTRGHPYPSTLRVGGTRVHPYTQLTNVL